MLRAINKQKIGLLSLWAASCRKYVGKRFSPHALLLWWPMPGGACVLRARLSTTLLLLATALPSRLALAARLGMLRAVGVNGTNTVPTCDPGLAWKQESQTLHLPGQLPEGKTFNPTTNTFGCSKTETCTCPFTWNTTTCCFCPGPVPYATGFSWIKD